MKTVTYDDAAWVLVPIEPTLEMKVGGNQELSAWVAPAMHSVDAWRAMLKAAPIPTAQIQPDAIPSFDELERRYFPEGRKKRLKWEAEQRALIWRGATLNNQAQPSAQDREDAQRYRWLRAENAKPNPGDMGVISLAVVADDVEGGKWVGADLDTVIDAARAAKDKS